MSSRVIEKATGAQILPPGGSEVQRESTYAVVSCCSADLRATSERHRELAEQMEVRTDGTDR